MTGLYDGIGAAIIFSLILLVYVPLLSLLVLKEIGLYRTFNKPGLSILLQVLTFFLLVALTLLVLRSAPYVAMDWVLFFGIAITLTYLALKFIKNKRTEK